MNVEQKRQVQQAYKEGMSIQAIMKSTGKTFNFIEKVLSIPLDGRGYLERLRGQVTLERDGTGHIIKR